MNSVTLVESLYETALNNLTDEEILRLSSKILHARNIPCILWSPEDVEEIIKNRVEEGDLSEMEDSALQQAAREIWIGGLKGLTECTDGDWDVIRSSVDRYFKINGHDDD